MTKTTKTIAKTVAKTVARKGSPRIAVSELNLRKAAGRLLATTLVSTEVYYIQRELGSTATQEDLDAKVVAVRGMPWTSIVGPE